MDSISGFCPHCHKGVTFSWIDNGAQGGKISNYSFLTEYFENETGMWLIGICPTCKKGVLINVISVEGQEPIRNIYPFPLPSLPLPPLYDK